jgi:hypothetical protein
MHPDTCKDMMMRHARPTSVGLRTATVDLFVHAEKQSQGLYHEGKELQRGVVRNASVYSTQLTSKVLLGRVYTPPRSRQQWHVGSQTV